MTRTVFYGFGAYVGTIGGQKQCSWWPDDPNIINWATSLLVPIDLSKNPTAARNGVIPVDQIVVDDDILGGGLTEIGPLFPLGRPAGACWLRDTYWNTLGANKPARVPNSQWYDYELTSVQYWDGELGDRRFFGLHGKIVDVQAGLSKVKIWQPGWAKSPTRQVAGVAWLDLAQVSDPDFTTIKVKNDEGAVFLDRDTAQALTVRRPKIPSVLGVPELY